MPTKATPTPEPTPEERRAQKLARIEAHRNRRPRHSASNPLTYDLSAFPPCNIVTVVNVPEGAEVEVSHVQA